MRTDEAAEPRPDPAAPAPGQFRVPLSLGQQEIWNHLQTWPAVEHLFHDTVRIPLPGPADHELASAVVDRLLRRHELLRTAFRGDEAGQPYQSIAATVVAPPVGVVDLSALAPDVREEELHRLLALQHAEPFDVSIAPLLHAGLFATGADTSLLALTIHHLVSDIATEGILAADITELHRALASGDEPELPPLPLQYADFAVWQRRLVAERGVDAERNWWLRTLDGMPLDIPLPHDRPPSPTTSKRTSCVEFVVPADVHASMQRICREERSTLFIVSVAAVQTLVAQYTGRTDIVVLTTLNGRDRHELERIVGPIANGALLRADLSGDPSFLEIVQRSRAAVLAVFEHQHLPLEQVVGALRERLVAAGIEQHPQVPVSVEFFHTSQGHGQQAGSVPACPPGGQRHIGAGSAEVQDTYNPLAFRMFGDGHQMWGRLAYHEAVFDQATAERLAVEFRRLLTAVAHDPDLRISELPAVGRAAS
ncbi:MAG TPA: condensation domain-containing protein [Acidimicrobiales bacterium]|nr:condensation domain-containing protein [Acidimicrobiales bacterium]